MTTFLPAAWLGYGHDKTQGGFYVRICPSCPGCGQALAEAKSSQLRIRMVLCSFHCQQQTNKRLGEKYDN